jgi:Arc/MetJ-type ribon-helix-helix transcriptional regulator
MGKPLMIQPEDDNRIESLKEKTGARSKVDVVRAALTLLEEDVKRSERVKRWERAAKVVGKSGLDVLKEFQTKERFKSLP